MKANKATIADHLLTIPRDPWRQYDGFSQEDVWHEMRALGCDERQAIKSLNAAEARLND